MRGRVLQTISHAGKDGAIADEIEAMLNLSPINVRPRIAELRRSGEIMAHGTRKGRSGIAQPVWKIAPPLPNEVGTE